MARADDDLLEDLGKRPARRLMPEARGPSRPMRRLIAVARVVGVVLGGSVSFVGLMACAGASSGHLAVRLGFALLVVVLVPAFVADRALRVARGGGLGLVVDAVAVTLLAIALVIVGLGNRTQHLVVEEGDRHARAGSRTLARFTYFVAGVSPRFPAEATTSPTKGR